MTMANLKLMLQQYYMIQGEGQFCFEVVVNGINRALKLRLDIHLYMCEGLQRQM